MSGEFPTFAPNDGVKNGALLIRYIVHCMNSPQYLTRVDVLSTGSTKESRNRFNQALFLDFELQVPKALSDVKRLVKLFDAAAQLRARQEELLEQAKKMRDDVALLLPMP